MMDSIKNEALRIVEWELSGEVILNKQSLARDIVVALQEAGLLARCMCPVGFGAVRDPRCPTHGNRQPNHTITGVSDAW